MGILVTGGTGFIGSHIVDRLVKKGYDVTVLDNLSSTKGKEPDYLNPKARFVLGSIQDKALLERLVQEADVIFHEAASVGIAQSNYEVVDFVDNNSLGTAKLLQAIIDSGKKPKFILSTSNTTYGEGLYNCPGCNHAFHPPVRTSEEVDKYGFELVCPKCKKPAEPIPTPETTELNCNSVYAFTKKTQEELALFLGKLYSFPVVALKYFNVFGPRQSLSNPYTGVSAIFMSRVKNGGMPSVYEDGDQTRDFISVHDVVEANMLAMENSGVDNEIFNIGSGNPIKIKTLAEEICNLYNVNPKIDITYKFRKGDIRHCIADISKANRELGWKPKISFREALKEIYEWAKTQESKDESEKANRELKERGLI